MDNKILNEITSIKKMMGLISEQSDITDAGSEYRTRNGIKLNKINSEEDLKNFITLGSEIAVANAYKQLTGLDTDPNTNKEILERFNQIATDFLKFLTMKCENYGECKSSIGPLYDVYANNKRPLYDELGIDNKNPKLFTNWIWRNHVEPKLKA